MDPWFEYLEREPFRREHVAWPTIHLILGVTFESPQVAPVGWGLPEDLGEALQDVIRGFRLLSFPGGYRLLADADAGREFALANSEALPVTRDPRPDRAHATNVRLLHSVYGVLPKRTTLVYACAPELHACNPQLGVVWL